MPRYVANWNSGKMLVIENASDDDEAILMAIAAVKETDHGKLISIFRWTDGKEIYRKWPPEHLPNSG